jgi:hypoxanthine phosphoribosyltransferase
MPGADAPPFLISTDMTDTVTPERLYITADELLADSFRLGFKILDSGFRPTHIAGIWRGGTPVGIAVQELLDFCGVRTDHIAIRTSLYTGIDTTAARVQVHGLGYVVRHAKAGDSLLIVDDVYDSGRSIRQVIDDLRHECGSRTPEIRIATVYCKPAHCSPSDVPHYYLHETDRWLVFPHELAGLSVDEILAHKPGIDAIRERLAAMRGKTR